MFSKVAIISPTWISNSSKGIGGIKSSVSSMYRTVMRTPVVGDMLYKITCQVHLNFIPYHFNLILLNVKIARIFKKSI